MNLEAEYNKYFEKLEKLQDFMVGDLRRSSKNAQANFLVAMGVFNYIEILGSFYKFRNKYKVSGMKDKQCGIPRFDFAINKLFDSSYKKEFTKIKRIFGKPPYDMFRSGMSHEYLVKTYKGQTNNELFFTVVNPNDSTGYETIISREVCGIRIEKVNSKVYKIIIFCPKLIEDFNSAFEKLKKRLTDNVGRYRMHFVHRAKYINLDLMN